mmetsp:Transcript_4976/g.18027  ORF Transcript_4976/g.18027 Transcript_4976/m.18027 type:complete len:216 (-) Transcript_4976:86-733(-)
MVDCSFLSRAAVTCSRVRRFASEMFSSTSLLEASSSCTLFLILLACLLISLIMSPISERFSCMTSPRVTSLVVSCRARKPASRFLRSLSSALISETSSKKIFIMCASSSCVVPKLGSSSSSSTSTRVVFVLLLLLRFFVLLGVAPLDRGSSRPPPSRGSTLISSRRSFMAQGPPLSLSGVIHSVLVTVSRALSPSGLGPGGTATAWPCVLLASQP